MNASDGFVILSDGALEGLGIPTSDIADCIERAIRSQAAGDVHTSPKSALLPGEGRYMMTTLSTGDDPGLTIVKSVMVSPRNPKRGLPSTEGNIILQDSETGQLLAVMQAGWVTAVRTAGLSAVVARRLANPDARSIGFVGTGVQARSHLDAFADMFPIEEIRLLGRGRANIDRLIAHAESKGIKATAVESAEAAMRDADIVVSSVTLSFDMEPFIDAAWLKPGCFAAITDAATPWEPGSMPAFGTICIDNIEQELGSPNPMVSKDLISTDLGGITDPENTRAFDPARPSAFVFRGVAVGDFAVASLGYEKAKGAAKGNKGIW